MTEYIFVVIKDGARTVSYELPYETTISEIFDKWKNGWFGFDESSVKLNGKTLLLEMFEVFIGSVADGNGTAIIKVNTVFPKKGGED